MEQLPRRKRIRLDRSNYAAAGAACSITIATKNRNPVFLDPRVAGAAISVLAEHAAATGVLIHAYCLMPDHVHLVVKPSATCDIVTFVGQFKNLAQRAAWQHGVQGAFWQRSFWDHFVRADEDLQRVVDYVLNTPVQAGLVADWRTYPYCGSLVWEL